MPLPPRDPVHDPLREVRRALLRLHKALIDAEREVFEAERGRINNAQFLQALMEDPFFQWLRPYSGLLVEIDEALASRDRRVTPQEARAFVERAAALVEATPVGVFAADRLDEARRRDPAVLATHLQLTRHIAAAREAYPR